MFLPLVADATLKKKSQTRLAAIDYLGRKRHSRGSFHSKIHVAEFVLPVTLSSVTPLQTGSPESKAN